MQGPARTEMKGSPRVNWVDIVVLVIVAISAVSGLRRGAALQLFSYGGFWGGLLVGALLTPTVASHFHSRTTKALVALVLVLGMAFLLGTLGSVIGIHSGAALRRIKLGPLDAGLGVGVAVIATLLVVWIAGGLIGNSRFTSLASAVQSSRIVRALDDVLPPTPSVFAKVETFLGQEDFPGPFIGLPPAIGQFVPLPNTSAVNRAVNITAKSTVKIVGGACGLTQEGSGFVVGPDLVVTNAHVVAGVRSPEVYRHRTARTLLTPVLYDPVLDIAVLRVPGLSEPVLNLDPKSVGRGAAGCRSRVPRRRAVVIRAGGCHGGIRRDRFGHIRQCRVDTFRYTR